MVKKIKLALFSNGVSPLVIAVDKPSSVEQEVRDDTVAEQIKETKKGSTEKDEGVSKTRD